MGMKGSGRRNSGALCVVAKHAGARLQNCVTCELKMGGRVGRIPVCVSLLPVCGRHGVDLLSVERRADNHEGSLPAPGTVGESSKNRAHESSRLAQQGHLARPCCLLKGLLPCFCLQADFIGPPRRGLTSDDESRGRQVIEGVTELTKIPKVKFIRNGRAAPAAITVSKRV